MPAPDAPALSLPPARCLTLEPTRPTHFVGIGGIGMSGLAKILLEAGYPVSGSDVGENASVQALRAQGARIALGHAAANVAPEATLVVSTAIRPDNPEIAVALARGQTIVHRSDLLRAIFQGEALGSAHTIGVAGAHGKTSTTGMIAVALQAAGVSPTVVVGGKLPGAGTNAGTNALWGADRRLAVAELDESDGSLTRYQPSHAVLLNIELDHADHFTGGLAQLTGVFADFVANLPQGAVLAFNAACPHTLAVVSAHARADMHLLALCPRADAEPEGLNACLARFPNTVRYALECPAPDAHGCWGTRVLKNGVPQVSLQMRIPGAHQLFNAMAALAVGDSLGLPLAPMAEALGAFGGMGRRFERLGDTPWGALVDDYAHHPTETRAMTAAGRDWLGHGGGRLIVIFQPHRFTRLKTFWQEFLASFEGADVLYVCDVYAASEDPIAGVDSRAFCAALRAAGVRADVRYWPGRDWPALRRQLQADGQPSDLLLTMGAGDITHLLRGDWPGA